MTEPKESEPTARRFKELYRAICNTCNWAGPVRSMGAYARQDEEKHKNQNSDHQTEIITFDVPDTDD